MLQIMHICTEMNNLCQTKTNCSVFFVGGLVNLLKETFEIKKTMGTAPIKHSGGNVSRQRG